MTIQRAIKSYQSKDYDGALKLFNEALNEDSNYSQELIYDFIASIYLQSDDLENAVIYQQKSVDLHPDYRNLVSLGMTYHLLKEDEKAESAYNMAIALNPKKGEAYASLGALFLSQEKNADAASNLKKAAEFEPRIAVIHANLALAYAALGEEKLSEREFEIARNLKCKNLEEFQDKARERASNLSKED